jgi:hypothetical protein
VGQTLELWLFEGVQARQAVAAQLQQRGIRAWVRSAYKPLLHAFLEEIDTTELASVVIEYPCHEAADPRRFLLEGYPLEDVLPDAEVSWVAAQSLTLTSTSTSTHPQTEQLFYQLTLTDRSGLAQTVSIFAPNVLKTDLALGQQCLCPTGYLRVSDAQSAQPIFAQSLETEFEQAFATRLGVTSALALNCGTAALHLALKLCGVGPGDYVAVPALSFVATVNPVRYLPCSR